MSASIDKVATIKRLELHEPGVGKHCVVHLRVPFVSGHDEIPDDDSVLHLDGDMVLYAPLDVAQTFRVGQEVRIRVEAL